MYHLATFRLTSCPTAIMLRGMNDGVVLVPSASQPNTFHRVAKDGSHCDCEGFRYRASCKHVAAVKAQSAQPAQLTLAQLRALVVAARARQTIEDARLVAAAGAAVDDWAALGCRPELYRLVARVVARVEDIAKRPLPAPVQRPTLAKGTHHWSCEPGSCLCGGTGEAQDVDAAMNVAGWR